MGHVLSKNTSLGQILEKSCVHSSVQIFSPIHMKLGQNVCCNKIFDEDENGSCPVKKYVTGSNLRKISCSLFSPNFQSDTHETWSECLMQ